MDRYKRNRDKSTILAGDANIPFSVFDKTIKKLGTNTPNLT
jgi:hypothetical protein